MAGEDLVSQSFLGEYGSSAPVEINGRPMTLGQAIAMEGLLCTGDQAARQDQQKRTAYLAGMLAAAGVPLTLEHQAYLPGRR